MEDRLAAAVVALRRRGALAARLPAPAEGERASAADDDDDDDEAAEARS